MSAKVATIRVMKELQQFNGGSQSFKITPDESNALEWNCELIGPDHTPYEGHRFDAKIKFPSDYPFSPPLFKFTTKIYHLNISETGEPCLKSFKETWKMSSTCKTLIEHILSLLSSPNSDDPLIPELASLYKIDNKRYLDVAKAWTETYAKKVDQEKC